MNMGIEELIGFIISIMAVLFLIIRQISNVWSSIKHPEQYARDQKIKEERKKALMRSLNTATEDDLEERKQKLARRRKKEFYQDDDDDVEDLEDEARIYPTTANVATKREPSRSPSKQPLLFITPIFHKSPNPIQYVHEQFDASTITKKGKTPTYVFANQEETSRGKMLVKQLRSPKDMVILHEVIGKAKANDY